MEDVDAVPTPYIKAPNYIKPETEEDESSEEKTDISVTIDNNYIFSISKKRNNIIFKVQLKEVIIPMNYELICDSKFMNGLSKIFTIFSNMDEIYKALIDGLKDTSEEIKIELIKDKVICHFIFDYKIKKENLSVVLAKKKVDLNAQILNDEFSKINKNQKNLEEKLEKKINEINTIMEKQNQLQEEFKQKMKEIEELKKAKEEYLNASKSNENKIQEIENNQKELKSELDQIKAEIKEKKNDLDIKNEIKTEIKNINNLIQNQKKETNDSISKHNKSIQILFNNSKIFDDSIKKINKDITSIKQAQEELKEENENILERIENIENNDVDEKKFFGKN